MRTCPACHTEPDQKALAAGRCSKCGAALRRVPQRNLHDHSQQSAKPPEAVDLETIGKMKSIDIDVTGESLTGHTNVNPDTIQTIEASSLLSGGAGDFSVHEEPVPEHLNWPKPKTTPLTAEQTVEFVTSVEEAILAESMVTAHWKENVVGGETNPNATIRQDKTVSDAIVTRSSVVVKSRQFRAPNDAKQPINSPLDAPDYELLDVIGEGGMGVVYSARQSAIARTVAVKMLKKNDAQTPEQREKFISEAVVTGELDHPNIVPIYDLGTNDAGALFYSMKRVKGTPWDDVLKKKSLDENLSILIRVADAVAFAHANGVIHRDLKPENIMLGDYGEVLVMDWGLARISAAFPNASSVSQSDVMGGTPAYMAPEMATGPIELITPASDIYLLGAILYEIITGRPPHSGKTVMACLLAAAKNQIPPVEHANELYDIALKAMSTKIPQRYQTVHEFQDALRDYQSHSESILLTDSAEKNLNTAESSGDYELYSRALYGFEEALAMWDGNLRATRLLSAARLAYAGAALKRDDFDLGLSLLDANNDQHRALLEQLQAGQGERNSRVRRLAMLKRLVAALLLAVAGIVSVALVVVRAERDEAVTQRIRAEDAEDVAQKNYEEAEAARKVAETERLRAESEEAKALEAEQVAVAAKEAEEYEAYVARIGLANAKIEESAFDRADQLLAQCDPEHKNWEWGRLSYLCNLSEKSWPVDGSVEAVAFSPDGQLFASGDLDNKARIWNRETGDVLHTLGSGGYVHAVAFDPAGERLALGSADGLIRIYKVSDGTELATLEGHGDAVLSVEFSSDGSRLLSSGYDNTARIWDLTTGEEKQQLKRHNWWVWSAEFSPDGERIVTASQDGKAIVWQLGEDREYEYLTEFSQHRGPVYEARFSPDGSQVATAGYDRRVLLWNPDEVHPVDVARRIDGQPDLPAPFVELGVHTGPARCLTFAPDGKTLASGGQDNVIRIWNLATGKQTEELRGHASHVRDCAFSNDGEWLLSGGRDQRIKLWQPAQYAEMVVLNDAANPDAVLAAHFSRDGKQVVTASRDRTASLWDVANHDLVRRFSEGHEFLASTAVFFADGSRLATGAGDGTVRIWDVATGTQLLEITGTGYTAALAVSADGQWLVSGSAGNDAQLWNTNSGERIAVLEGHEGPITAARFSANGEWLATGDDRGRGCLWQRDPQSQVWSQVHWLDGHSRTITGLAFADGDRVLVSSSGDNTCGQWDVATGAELRDRVLKHPDWVAEMDVSDDGTQVITSCDDGKLRLWSLADAELLATMEPTDKQVVYTSVDLAPDGRTALATCSATGEVFLWDVVANRSANPEGAWLNFSEQGGSVFGARFAPSGDQVLTIGGNDARLWDVGSKDQLIRFSPHGAVADVDLAPDGKWLVTGSWDQSAKIWDAATGEAVRKLDGVHTGYINSVQFSPSGEQVLTASDDGTARLWDAATGKPVEPALVGHEGRVRQARFDTDGSRVVTSSNDKTARIWDAKTGAEQQILRGHEWAVLCGEFSHDGTRVITGGEDNIAIIWDVATGEVVLKLAGHTDSVTAVALSPDGTRALTGSQDNTVKLWDALTGKEILTLTGHKEEVTSVGFSPDGMDVLSSGRDGQTILWPSRNWK
ncbi:MAG: protein kinase [Bythopirellula sp.]|nr:protein kinase [Bythopirellula sp.]